MEKERVGEYFVSTLEREEYILRLKIEKLGLLNRLAKGTITIKKRHRIAKINPYGEAIEIPLSTGQFERRLQALTTINNILEKIE